MFIIQAYKSLHEFWRYFVGLMVIIFAWQFIGIFPLGLGLVIASEDFLNLPGDIPGMVSLLGSNWFLFLMILSFATGLLGIFLVVKYLHRQKILHLTTSRAKVDWGRIWFGFLAVVIVNLMFFGISYYLEPDLLSWNFKPVPFIILSVIAIFLLPLQTSFEEYLFRGYLMQGIGVAVQNRWVPLLITSVVFGLLHIFNPEVEKLGYITMVYYIGTGLLLGIITLMDEGMELALGFHAGNNILTALLVTTDWSALQTDALFVDSSVPEAGMDILIPVLITFPLFLTIFGVKYKWKNWQEKLTGPVLRPVPIEVEEIGNS